MEYQLTSNVQLSKTCKDGKCRSLLNYYLNGIKILTQKLPFDTDFDEGYNKQTAIENEYLLNNNLHQKRTYKKIRYVKYPISKKILKNFKIPKDLKIYHE